MAARRSLIGVFLVCALGLSLDASGRDAEGRLDRILFPHEGCPAVVIPGRVLAVIAEEQGEIVLESDGLEFPLEVIWSRIPGGRVSGRIVVDADMEPGRYDLRWRIAERVDRTMQAVHIVENVPEDYLIDMIRDTRFRKESSVADFFASQIDPATPMVLSGVVVSGNRPEVHRALIEALHAFEGSVFIAPNAGEASREIESFWGPQPFQFLYGPDAYLVWSGNMGFDANGWVVEELHRLRRQALDARWSMGFVPAVETRDRLRAYVTLWMDEPLHYVFTSETTREIGAYPAMRTGAIALPSLDDGKLRLRMRAGAVDTNVTVEKK